MKVKLSGKEKDKILDCLLIMFAHKLDVKRIDEELMKNYGELIHREENGCLEIINDFYVEDTVEDSIGKYSEDDLIKYVVNNYKKLFISNLGKDTLYNIENKRLGIKFDELIKNGTLVFMLSIIVDLNNSGIMGKSIKLKENLKKIEKDFSDKLDLDVRILIKEKIIKKAK